MKTNNRLALLAFAAIFSTVFNVRAFYDPTIGRWASRDPVGEYGGVNLYGILQNDPVNYYDYLGLYSIDPNKMQVFVAKCEIVILFGYQENPTNHWRWYLTNGGCNAATGLTCYPVSNSFQIPSGQNLLSLDPDIDDVLIFWGNGMSGPYRRADPLFDEAYRAASQTAADLCKKNNCDCPAIKVSFIWMPKSGKPVENPTSRQTDYGGKNTIQNYTFDCKTGIKTPVSR